MKLFFIISLSVALLQTGVAQTPITFVDPIPAAYNPMEVLPKFADICPDIKLPAGHVYFKPPTKQGWTVEQVMAKGVTHWSRGSFEKPETQMEAFKKKNPQFATREYEAVPRIREIFDLPPPVGDKWWPNGFLNEKQAREKGKTKPIHARLWVGETMEGTDWVPSGEPMWDWFYDEFTKRYEEQKKKDGIPYYVAHNYFEQLPQNFQLAHEKREVLEKLYETPPEKIDAGQYSVGKSIGKPNTILEGIYISAPDQTPQQLLAALVRMELVTRMGKYTGMFIFNVHEWRPGFPTQIEYPEGTFYRTDKLPIDPNLQILVAFLSQEYGTIFIEWGLMPYQSLTKKPVAFNPEMHKPMDDWFAKGSTKETDFPFYHNGESNEINTMPYLGDMTHFGIVLWSQTGGKVAGGKFAYAPYKIDGKEIKTQKNGSDLIASYYDKRGVVTTRTLGKKMMICYFNMFADNDRYTLLVQNPANPSETFTNVVCGNGIHATLVNLR